MASHWDDSLTAGIHANAFMRALVVVDGTPAVERPLGLLQILEAAPVEHFGFQRTMKALALAVGLGMVRSTMADAGAQSQQPDGQMRGQCPGERELPQGGPLSALMRTSKPKRKNAPVSPAALLPCWCGRTRRAAG
jgi:hypothetical protein